MENDFPLYVQQSCFQWLLVAGGGYGCQPAESDSASGFGAVTVTFMCISACCAVFVCHLYAVAYKCAVDFRACGRLAQLEQPEVAVYMYIAYVVLTPICMGRRSISSICILCSHCRSPSIAYDIGYGLSILSQRMYSGCTSLCCGVVLIQKMGTLWEPLTGSYGEAFASSSGPGGAEDVLVVG